MLMHMMGFFVLLLVTSPYKILLYLVGGVSKGAKYNANIGITFSKRDLM